MSADTSHSQQLAFPAASSPNIEDRALARPSVDIRTETNASSDYLTARYGYVARAGRFWDRWQGAFLQRGAIDVLEASRLPAGINLKHRTPTEAILASHESVFDTIEYNPGRGSSYIDGGLHILNTYKPSPIGASPGKVQPFLTLVDYLFDGDRVAIEVALGFLATLVQKPGTKIRFALLHVNQREGTGRGTLFKLLARLLGPHNVTSCDTERLTGRFNGYMMSTQLLIVPELLVGDAGASRQQLWNRIKPLITDDTLQIESKGVDTITMPNRLNLILASNHPDAVTVGTTDRRLFVWQSQSRPRRAGYYRALHDWIEEDTSIAAVRSYLLDYDARGFNPNGSPPTTAARDELIHLSASPTEQFLRDALSERAEPFECDLINANQLYEWLLSRGHKPRSTTSVAGMLKRLGAVQVNDGNQVRIGGAKPRLWAMRELARYCSMRESELAAHFRPLKQTP